MGGRASHLQLLLALASAVILGSKSCGTHNHILPSPLETVPTRRARSVFISPGTGCPSHTQRYWVPFRHLLGLTGLQWRYSNPPTSRTLFQASLAGFELCRFGMDPTENTASHNSSIVACITVATLTWCVLCCNLVTGIVSA
jgi:hypothetical protein